MPLSAKLPRYVFATDQGRVFFSHTDPTPEDFGYAEVGMVTIVRLEDLHYLDRGGRWLPIPAGELGCTEIDGEETPPFHGLPERIEPNSAEALSPHARF